MADPAEALWTALHEALPIMVVYYGDYGLLESAVAEIDSLADPDAPVVPARSIEEVLQADAASLVMLVPDDEAATVRSLEGYRDHFLDRQAPIVLFLLRDGSGSKQLRDSPSLMSWVRGNTIDPEQLALIEDLEAERQAFEQDAGMTPEQWIAHSRSPDASLSTESMMRTYRALLLERR